MKKRILLVSPSELCVGGVPKVIMTLVKELHEEYTFDVATLSAKAGYFDEEFESYGGRIYRIPSIQYLEHKILYPLSFFQIKKEIACILRCNHYDIIHCHSGGQDAACQVAAQKAGIPVRISHGHGVYVWLGRNLVMRAYLSICKKFICKNTTVRVACSAVAGDTLFNGMQYENLLNPINLSEFADVEHIPHDGINLIQIGYFCRLKNQIFSLKLLHALRKRNVNAHLDLIGYPKEPQYLKKMNEILGQLDLEKFVSLLPPDFDKRKAFAQADYLLLPSESEGLGIVALESQAAGIPCLASDNVPKDVDMGAVFFLPHNELNKWADIIVRGVEVDAEKMTDNLQKISTQAYAEKIRNIYEQKG